MCTTSGGCLKSSPVRPAGGDIPTSASNPSTTPTQLSTSKPALEDDSVNKTSSPGLSLYSGRQFPPLLPPPPPPPINLSPAPPPSDTLNASRQGQAFDPTPVTPPARLSTPVATPLLDAAIERVEAIKRIQSETLAAELQQDEQQKARKIPVIGVSSPKANVLTAHSAQPVAESKHSDTPTKPPTQPTKSATRPPASQPSHVAHDTIDPVLSKSASHSYSDHPAPELPWVVPMPERPATEPVAPSKSRATKELEIAEFRLCRDISGFGSFEVFAENSFRPGQRILIYCEMNGLKYEPAGDAFHSTMSSRLELLAEPSGKVAWEQNLGAAEETCRRLRRDYFVNYLIELPTPLTPGRYRLRLIQTDEVGKHTTSAELPVVIKP
jgi:hypothetical protein